MENTILTDRQRKSIYWIIRNNFHVFRRKIFKKINAFFKVFPERKYRRIAVNTDFDLGGKVKLYYWELSKDFTMFSEYDENIGDYLSKVVVSYFAPESKSNGCKKEKTLYGIGSIIGFRCQNATVWGSGIINLNYETIYRTKWSLLDLRAVRGPNTRNLLIKLGKNCPEIFGDPAILMPFIYKPENVQKKYKCSVIFHFSVNDFEIPIDKDINQISPVTTDYKNFIDQIVESELIISSSLHGIILAETYGTPAILLLHKGQSTFKYEDWYYSTGRYNIVVANSVEDALGLNPMELPELSRMQRDLLNAFPYDLWNGFSLE